MADEKQPPPKPSRHPTLPLVPPEEERTPTDEVPPLAVGGRIQYGNVVLWAKRISVAIGIVAAAITGAYQVLKPMIDDYSQRVKQKAEDGYQVTKHAIEDHDKRLHDLEVRLDAVSRAPAPVVRRGLAARRPAPPVAIPPAKTAPIVPRPLPNDLDKAQAQIRASAPAPHGLDGGP